MSQLYYRFEKHGRKVMEEYLRRVYRYAGPWDNRDLEFVQIDDNDGEMVWQTFFEDQEIYPVITISTTAGQNVRMGFNDQIDDFYDINYPMGTRGLALVTTMYEQPVAFKLPNFSGSVCGVNADMVHVENYPTENIDVRLFQNYFTTGSVLLTSGSIRNFESSKPVTCFAQMSPQVVLSGSGDYWIEFMPQSGSVYQLCLDTGYNGQYSLISYSGSVPTGTPASGSLVGGMRLSPVFRLGGAHEFTMTVKCSMKNSINRAQDLADIAEIYVKLAQYGTLDRSRTNDTKIELAKLVNSGVSWFTTNGISIKNVSKGAIENRKRGDNDIIFTVGLSVELRTEWSVDFGEQQVLEILPTDLEGF